MKTRFLLSCRGVSLAVLLFGFVGTARAGLPGRPGSGFDVCPFCTGRAAPSDDNDRWARFDEANVAEEMVAAVAADILPAPQASSASRAIVPASPPAPVVSPASASARSNGVFASEGTAKPAAPAAAVKPEPPPEIKKGADGYWRVSFANLASYSYPMPPDNAPPKAGSVEGIPAEVRALEGKRVAVQGYMVPVKMEGGFVKEFLVLRSAMMCCYGLVPKANEWVYVRLKGKGTVTMMDVPLSFYGTLHVGAVVEDKMFAGLYQIDGDKVAVK